MELVHAMELLEDDCLKRKFFKAVAASERAIDLYGLGGVALSFNGGKDSTVLLHVLRAAVALHRQRLLRVPTEAAEPAAQRTLPCATSAAGSQAGASSEFTNGTAATAGGATENGSRQHNGADGISGAPGAANGSCEEGLGGMHVFVFNRSDDFPEIRDFVAEMDDEYGLSVEECSGDFKEGLSALLGRTGAKAIFLGTRKGDPNADGQDLFCPSSVGWPGFMRVNPVLDWTYSDVWAFLRAMRIPYCQLYDRGYTSVGGTANTTPNRSLQKEDGSFAPAHILADSRLERAGRVGPEKYLTRKNSLTSRLLRTGSSALTRSAALLIIGDEILAAKIQDKNTCFLCAELRAIGWTVAKVVIVSDDVAAIAAEAHALSEAFELVITAGGVGPTPDDVTMAGIAAALGVPLTRDPTLEGRLRGYFFEHITPAHLKLADIPEGESELIELEGDIEKTSPFPLVQCRNIFILPGVPELLQQKWRTLKEHLKVVAGQLQPFHTVALRLNITDETVIAPALGLLAVQMADQLTIGSYPLRVDVEDFIVDSYPIWSSRKEICTAVRSGQLDGAGIVLSLESKNLEVLEAARELLLASLPDSVTVMSQEADSRRHSKRASTEWQRKVV